MKKVFAGWRDGQGRCVVHVVRGKASTPLPPRNDVWNHSPDGFEWGYGGSGPAQLALAILCHVTGSDHQAAALHQRFKAAVVARLPHGTWQITEQEVWDWLELVDYTNLPAENMRLGKEAFYDA